MGAIDLEALLSPIDEEAPSGEDLEYDAAFLELERLAEGKPEQQMGDEVIPGEDPAWKDVQKQAIELLGRTRDLRVAMHVLRSTAHLEDMSGVRDALALVRGYVRDFWPTVHPQLDPEDDNDPTMRVNILVALCDLSVLSCIRQTPLLRSQLAGTFSFKDVLVARGELPAPEGSDPPSLSLITGAFSECDLEELEATTEACAAARDEAVGIENDLTDHVGSSDAADLSALASLLSEIHAFLAERLGDRGVAVAGVQASEAAAEGGSAGSAPITGEISSREDVVRMLEKISRYYESREPSSPVPILMERAKRLVHANFLELIEDIAPDGLTQVQTLRGRQASEADEE
jgi:type VI secretion system protein ImpA